MYHHFNHRWIILSMAMLLSAATVRSQQNIREVVDSIKTILPSAQGKLKYELTYKIAYELFDVNYAEALVYATDAKRLALELGDSLAISRSGRMLGQLLRRNDRLDEAIEEFNKALAVSERNAFMEEQKKTLNSLALAYNFKAAYDLALLYNFKSLEIREKEGNKVDIGIALNNIGLVYYKIGNFEQALEFYNRALRTRESESDKLGLDQLYVNLSLCHTYLGNYDSAASYVLKGFEVCGSNCSTQLKIEGEYCLGKSSLQRAKFLDAKNHFETSYALSREVGDKRFLAENALGLALVYYQSEDPDNSFRLLKEAEEISLASGYNEILIHTYKRIATIYRQNKDFENASLYQGKYIELKDSVYSESLIKNLARVQTDYEERENIKTIEQQNENLRLKEVIITRQKQIYFFIAALAVLGLALALVFSLYSRALSKAKAQVSMLNETLEAKVKERTRALQSVNNELDNFIYKTSHDIRGPLASLKGIANVALLELEDPLAKEYLQKLDASADKLNGILTRLLIVNQVNHAVLAPMKINFEELINEILVFEKKKGTPQHMNISFEIDPEATLITDRHLLRIILENLVDNAIKYHNTSERVEPFVKVKVGMAKEKVMIKVIDNGIGIQERNPQKLFQMFVRASERSESGGIGLYLTKLASERLGARVDFATTSERHTQFTVTLPPNLVIILEERDRQTPKA